ncbi:MAG: nickel pincer cofactor biosynthesis protein LarB [Gemmatimonadaceae bacterium]
MIRDRVRDLLARVAEGSLDVETALNALAFAPAETLSFATIDHHRALRQGFPEVIFAEGKTTAHVVAIAERIGNGGEGFLATRVSAATREALLGRFPTAIANELGRTVRLSGDRATIPKSTRTIAIVTAGTADLPVAEEAAETAVALGHTVDRLDDIGVAGIHRVLAQRERLTSAAVVIVLAGMDGALPSVVGGLVDGPVIAVPTSVGYGASFGGLAALLAMLNSCASGVTVVNIDNGFGAAAAASRIVHR